MSRTVFTAALLALALVLATGCGKQPQAPTKPRVVSARSLKSTPGIPQPTEKEEAPQPALVATQPAPPAPAPAAPTPPAPSAQTKGKIEGRLKGRARITASAKQVASAPADYLYGVTVTTPRYIQKQARLAELQRAIEQFRTESGRYPDDLGELARYRGVRNPAAPDGYHYKYDKKTGKLLVLKNEEKK